MSQLMFPDIVGQYRQGEQYGQQQAADKIAGQVYGADPTQRQPLLSQLAALNPQLAVGLGNKLTEQDLAQAKQTQMTQADHAAKLNKAANFMLQQVQTGDPARIQGAYQAVRPYLAELSGQQPPDQFDQSMIPHLYQILGQTGGMPDPKTFNVSPGGKVVDISGRVIADNPTQAHDSGEVATMRALQSDPGLMAVYQKMHPRAVVSVGGGAQPEGSLLTQDAQDLLSSALTHGYSIPLPAFGIGAAGAKAKAQALNTLAHNIKAQGMSMDDAVSGMLQGKTATAGLTDVQKSSAKINAWENSASKQADIALQVSDSVDRSGIPAFNRWINAGRQATGDVDVARLNNATNTLAEEYARVMGGGNSTATDSTRALAHSMLNSAMTKEQFQGVVGLMRQEMAARKQALADSVNQTRGTIVGRPQNEAASMPSAQPTPTARPRATNPQTGQTVEWDGQNWTPVNG